jgi:hypothetical protein
MKTPETWGLWRIILSDLVVQSALRLRLILPIDLRLAPPINLPALPSTRPPAFTGCRIVSAHPFTRPSTRVACRPSGPASRTQPPTLIGCLLLRFDLLIDLRLAPPTNRPANPLNSTSGLHRLSHRPAHPFTRPSTCVACRPSGPAFRTQPPTSSVVASPAHPYRSTFGLRRRPTLWPRLRTQPPALTGCRMSPTQLSHRPSTCAADRPSSLAFELNLRLTTSSSVEKNIRIALPVDASANKAISVDKLPNAPLLKQLPNCNEHYCFEVSASTTCGGIQPCCCIQFAIRIGVIVNSFCATGNASPMCVPCAPSSKICNSAFTPAAFSAL